MIKKFTEFKNSPSENLKYHIENNISILDNVFRSGSDSFFSIIKEARDFKHLLSENDKELFENTDLGKFGTFNGKIVPLDLPMENDSINEAEYKGREVDLNHPTRSSGPKKYRVL